MGGIVGCASGGAGIYQSYNVGDLWGSLTRNTYAGGIVGYKDSTGPMNDCYNKGWIAADVAGGLAGSCTGGSVKGCYSSSTNISGSSYKGTLIGYDEVVLNYVAWSPISRIQGIGNIQDSEWTNDYKIWSFNDMKVSSNLLAWLKNSSSAWNQVEDVNEGLPYLTNIKPKTAP